MRRVLTLLLCLVPLTARATDIVAAENFYGDVAQQVGGDAVHVVSILSRPDQDPHLFEATPSVARAIATASIIVMSGIDYDPWMEKLLRASPAADRQVIDVAALTHRHTGDNPHIWYEIATMRAYAAALAQALSSTDPGHAATFQQGLHGFETALRPVETRIAHLRQRLQGAQVTATEPVLGYMFEQLGLRNRNARFQRAVMNDTEPAASDVAAFEKDLRTHRVKLLVTNSQASDPVADRMTRIAREAGVPVVGATETEPPGQTYQQWMTATLDAIDNALPPVTQ